MKECKRPYESETRLHAARAVLQQKLRSAKGIAAEAEIERLRPVLDATELETSLRKAESRAERAERRAQELEAQLAEARRSARQPLASDDTNSAPPGQARAPALPAAEKVATKKGATPKAPSGHREGVTDTDGKNGCGALLQQIRLERAADVDACSSLAPPRHSKPSSTVRFSYWPKICTVTTCTASRSCFKTRTTTRMDGVEPTWRLCHGGTVWTANNEVGMSHADVRAICDTNNSSSKRTESGRIGRKGVGMKSVFKISSQPHVLSADFAFKFDLELNGLLGYALPEPLGSETVASLPASVRTPWAEQKQTIFTSRCAPRPRMRLRCAMRYVSSCIACSSCAGFVACNGSTNRRATASLCGGGEPRRSQ